ncbi:hypothetical protein F4679DRAFT_60573 [Xylaria curta]|nr:hypothetical protein F4679DRAFT_60573 [Xylaria curta]
MARLSSTIHTYLDSPFHPTPQPVSIPTVTSHYRMRRDDDSDEDSAVTIAALIVLCTIAGLALLALIIEAVRYYIRRYRELEVEGNSDGIELHNILQEPVAPPFDHDNGTAVVPIYSGSSPRIEGGNSVSTLSKPSGGTVEPGPSRSLPTESSSVAEPRPTPPQRNPRLRMDTITDLTTMAEGLSRGIRNRQDYNNIFPVNGSAKK